MNRLLPFYEDAFDHLGRPRDSRGPRPTHLYLIRRVSDGAFKVGISTNVDSRFRQIQRGIPDRLELVSSWPGDISDEREAHAALAPYRLRGEWFLVPPGTSLPWLEDDA